MTGGLDIIWVKFKLSIHKDRIDEPVQKSISALERLTIVFEYLWEVPVKQTDRWHGLGVGTTARIVRGALACQKGQLLLPFGGHWHKP